MTIPTFRRVTAGLLRPSRSVLPAVPTPPFTGKRCKRWGCHPRLSSRTKRVVTNLLGLVKGRIYYHINNWYRGLQLLPSFSQNKADMERMMGLEEPVDFVTDHEKTKGQKLRNTARFARQSIAVTVGFFEVGQQTIPSVSESLYPTVPRRFINNRWQR